jgi:hypothetical protein
MLLLPTTGAAATATVMIARPWRSRWFLVGVGYKTLSRRKMCGPSEK